MEAVKRKAGRPKGTTRKVVLDDSAQPEYDIFFGYLAEQHGMLDDSTAANNRIISAIRATLFEKQLNVIEDQARWKSLVTARRCGKSYCAMAYAHIVALSRRAANIIIVTLTHDSGRNVFWKMFQKFHSDFGIEVDLHHTAMRVTFKSNGSTIRVMGADSPADVDKIRGGSYDLVVVDECKSFGPSLLRELVEEVAKPALADRRGNILLIGTPGDITIGPFYEATYPGYIDPDTRKPISRSYDSPEHYWVNNPDELYQWSRHSWGVLDNVTQPHLWPTALEEKQRMGYGDDHPTWLREYLGIWVPSESSFVYAYPTILFNDPDSITWRHNWDNKHGLPDNTSDWRFLLGMDMGFEDAFAMVVAAYNMQEKTLYHLWEFKQSHMDAFQVADAVQAAIARFGSFDAIIADTGNGKQLVETLNRHYGLYIQPAEKREKFNFISLLNADFHSRRIKILRKSELGHELEHLQWDLSKGSKEQLARLGHLKEHPGMANHLCDALLYLWRYSHHHFASTYKRPQPVDVEGWWAEYERKQIEKFDAQRLKEKLDEVGEGTDIDRDVILNVRDPLKDYYLN